MVLPGYPQLHRAVDTKGGTLASHPSKQRGQVGPGDGGTTGQPDHSGQPGGSSAVMKGPAMWNSFSSDARVGLTAEVITYPGGNGDEIHAWLARPDGDGPAPGIVAVHHLPGWDEFYREFAERLARHVYNVICPGLY